MKQGAPQSKWYKYLVAGVMIGAVSVIFGQLSSVSLADNYNNEGFFTYSWDIYTANDDKIPGYLLDDICAQKGATASICKYYGDFRGVIPQPTELIQPVDRTRIRKLYGIIVPTTYNLTTTGDDVIQGFLYDDICSQPDINSDICLIYNTTRREPVQIQPRVKDCSVSDSLLVKNLPDSRNYGDINFEDDAGLVCLGEQIAKNCQPTKLEIHEGDGVIAKITIKRNGNKSCTMHVAYPDNLIGLTAWDYEISVTYLRELFHVSPSRFPGLFAASTYILANTKNLTL